MGMRGRLHLVRWAQGLAIFLAATPLVWADKTHDDSAQLDPDAIIARLEQRIRQTPDLLADVEVDLERLRTVMQTLEGRVEEARLESARAYARMASYTATVLVRELKKVSASARVLAMTRQTGRTEEVERYEGRHQSLLKSIDRIAAQYADLIAHLSEIEADLVQAGFDEYEQHLVAEGFADQIKVHRIVIRHLDQYDDDAGADLKQWKSDLQSL